LPSIEASHDGVELEGAGAETADEMDARKMRPRESAMMLGM
jgi:hypothetical protein